MGPFQLIKPASEVTKTGVIGLLGTRATVRQPYVDRLASEFASDKKIIRFGAPDLVYAAESKLKGEKPDQEIILNAVRGLIDQKDGDQIDTIILACTHFPLVEEELQSAIDRPIHFVDGAKGIARRIDFLTDDRNWAGSSAQNIFVTTGKLTDIDPFRKALGKFRISTFEAL